jgi:hypothetical protein
MDFITAVQTCLERSVTLQQISAVHGMLKSFLAYYEKRYYQMENTRLPVCLSVFHQIAHVADYLKIPRPMWVYSLWVTERLYGMIVLCARNCATANRNIEVNLLLQEQRNVIPYLKFRLDSVPNQDRELADQHHDGCDLDQFLDRDEDEDGNIHLYRFFMALIANTAEFNSTVDVPILVGPCKTLTITSSISRALNQYRLYLQDSIMDMEPPTDSIFWAACRYPPLADS